MVLEERLGATAQSTENMPGRGSASIVGATYGLFLGLVFALPVYTNTGDSREFISVYQALGLHTANVGLGALTAAYANELARAITSPIAKLFPSLR